MFFHTALRRSAMVVSLSLLAIVTSGCPSGMAPPRTVDFVELDRYTGLWFEIASYPVFFNRNLVGVTAEYGLLPDGRISVLNRGLEGSLDGPESSISGTARVVDPESNAKLAVRFDTGFARLFEGSYWIVGLDTETYEWAVVSDAFRSTLFILSRETTLDEAILDEILFALESDGFDIDRLRLTPQPAL